MNTALILSIALVSSALAKEAKDDKGKRDAPDDFHHDGHNLNINNFGGGKAYSYSEVVQRIPRLNAPQPHLYHQPQHISPSFPRVPIPVKVPIPQFQYPAVKRLPYLVDKPVPISFQPSYQNFVITKVPLVYHATYATDHLAHDFNPYSQPPFIVGRNYDEQHY